MFPPVDEAVLRNNPDFAILYNKLTNVVLNPDGSSKTTSASRERAAVQKDLEQHRLTAAKRHLITRAIASASPPDVSSSRPSAKAASLPEPLLELLLLLPPLLEAGNSLAPDSLALLLSSPPLSDLESLMPDLAALVSASLRSWALNLARITHPSTNPSYLHRHIASLPQDLSNLTTQADEARRALAAARLGTVSSLTDLLQSYGQAVTHLIRALEAKHGVIARSLELRAAHVLHEAQLAEVDAEQTRLNLTKEVYPPDVTYALNNYASHLKDAKIRGEERIKGLHDELAEYGVGVPGGEAKEKTMREMARVRQEMAKQLGDAKVDIERLQKR
ncbi:hypothetical protein B0I35DRAFT_408965 [Stachybotrys elegans]|uniref:Uncharacterized protein n=1 Tax=Stachybotrys elegans TaxID=80388 RepID=A0A8K0WS75_9HYPO|nr:hypothetical protein B0I35DRAFT_408965 [Stachybotrys elegans]